MCETVSPVRSLSILCIISIVIVIIIINTVIVRSAREQKALDKEMGRVDKWLVMMHERAKWFPDKASNHKKLVDRVWKVS